MPQPTNSATFFFLNQLDEEAARDALTRCCGATRWVQQMLDARPFDSHYALMEEAEEIWWSLAEADWREAFAHHPKIGDIDSLRAKYASTQAWASGEQAGVEGASEAVIEGLAAGNAQYEAKFGYIFIVCATGKSAAEMLKNLQARLPNDPAREIHIAATEQLKITKLRLDKLTDAEMG